MKSKFLFLVCSLSILEFSCNFSSDEEYQKKCGGKIVFSESDSFQNFNVQSISNPASERVLSQLFEGLVKFHSKELAIVPCIAESFSHSSDFKTFTFVLKTDVFFHDNPCFEDGEGRLLNPQDVVYSFERVCTPKTNSPAYFTVFKNIVTGADAFYKGKSKTISGITIKNNTLVIQLNSPQPSFLEKLASINCSIVPKEGIELYGKNNSVGTGPFYLSSNQEDEKMILLKNKKYHTYDENKHQLPFLDSVIVYFETSSKSALEGFINGNQNLLFNTPNNFLESTIEKIKASKSIQININNLPLLSTTILEFNNLNPYLNNIHLRKAINYALDKNALSNLVFGDVHDKAGEMGVVHPRINFYRSDRIKGYTFDLEKAKQELKLSGFSDSLSLLSFVFSVNCNDFKSVQVAEEISMQLKANLGIELKLNFLTAEYKSEMMKYGRTEISLNTINAQFANPEAFLNFFYGRDVSKLINEPSFPNTSRYQNDKFDFSFERGRKSSNPEEAFRNFLIAENQLLDDAPFAVLWYENYNCIQNSKIKNLNFNQLFLMDFSEVYIEK